MMIWVLLLFAGCWWEIRDDFTVDLIHIGVAVLIGVACVQIDRQLADWMPS